MITTTPSFLAVVNFCLIVTLAVLFRHEVRRRRSEQRAVADAVATILKRDERLRSTGRDGEEGEQT